MILDILLAIAAVSFASSGWRQGLIVGALGFAGFLAGGISAMILTPRVIEEWSPSAFQTVIAAGIVLVAAVLGQVLATAVGSRLRKVLVWGPLRIADSTLGAVLSVAGMLVVSWFLATAARSSSVPEIARQVTTSQVLRTVDTAMPDQAQGLFSSFRGLLDEGQFPQVFGGLAPERILPIDPPDDRAVGSQEIRRAGRSIVQVSGSAPSCDRRVEGTGFVYADRHVLTNAHVVAGVSSPTVRVEGTGPELAARVVAFDSTRDVAVLFVPDLTARPLPLDSGASRGDGAVVAGFPRGGPYKVGGARVREQIRARGPDIYGSKQTSRDVLSLYATIQPGNSGGPLLTPTGGVYGLIFAKSVDDPETGYALTIGEISPVADSARRATQPVPTGECAL